MIRLMLRSFNLHRLKGNGINYKIFDQPVLPDKSPENALPYETDPVCEVLLARAFWYCRIRKASRGSGWLWTVVVSSSSCPKHHNNKYQLWKILTSDVKA